MTNSDPLFTILLPTHNRADVLPFAIQSILAQTISDFELLIVGDGCTDQTAEVVRGFDDPRIVWFDLPKAPAFGYANRNIALRQARGAYIAYMAHDDLWLPDHLERFLPALEQPGVELVYSQPLWVNRDGQIAPSIFDLDNPSTLNVFLARHTNRIPSMCIAHQRACFDRYGYWDESLPGAADWDMWIRIIEGGDRKNFVYLSEPTSLHFCADWRNNAMLDHQIVWAHFYKLDGFIPTGMKVLVPAEMTEQEAFWRAMSVQPLAWSKNLRKAIRQICDQRVAQSDTLIAWMLQHWPMLLVQAEDLKAHIDYLSRVGVSLNEQLIASQSHVVRLIEQIDPLSRAEIHLNEELAASQSHAANLTEQIDQLSKVETRLNEQLAASQSHAASLIEQINQLSAHDAALQTHIVNIESSLTWKLVARLLALKRRMIPVGTWREKVWLGIRNSLRQPSAMRKP